MGRSAPLGRYWKLTMYFMRLSPLRLQPERDQLADDLGSDTAFRAIVRSSSCSAPVIPAGQRAAAVIAENPRKPNRMIAGEIGVSHFTINEARKSTARHLPVDDRPTIDKPPKGELWDDQSDKCIGG